MISCDRAETLHRFSQLDALDDFSLLKKMFSFEKLRQNHIVFSPLNFIFTQTQNQPQIEHIRITPKTFIRGSDLAFQKRISSNLPFLLPYKPLSRLYHRFCRCRRNARLSRCARKAPRASRARTAPAQASARQGPRRL